MKDQIAKWFAWLKQATMPEDARLGHVYSDGRQLWAANGHALHAVDVATEKQGRVTLTPAGLLVVEEDAAVPPFAATLPTGEPVAVISVSAEALRRATAGQDGFVRLALYGPDRPLELSGAGSYALVMPVADVPAWWFWRPEAVD